MSPNVLLAENNLALVEFLPCVLTRNIPSLAMDTCSSQDVATHKLAGNSYDVVICNVGLAEADNFLLLRQHRTLHPLTPFIVTAGAQHREMACEAIDNGALDIIVTPLIPQEAVSTVQLARKLYELRKIIASRHNRLMGLREDHANRRIATWTDLKVVNRTIQAIDEKYESRRHVLSAYERTIPALESSVALLAKQASVLEHQAGEARKALGRVVGVGTTGRGFLFRVAGAVRR
jgi:DNA-binding NtrC family response regulator